jgi:hypothetical protein
MVTTGTDSAGLPHFDCMISDKTGYLSDEAEITAWSYDRRYTGASG